MTTIEDLQNEAEEANLSLGEIVESINNKADRDLSNTEMVNLKQGDYVTERGGGR